jgi:hypothetical protein
MPNLVPLPQVAAPEGVTHLSFSAGFLNLDFTDGSNDLQLSNVVNPPINVTATSVDLIPAAAAAAAATGTGTVQSCYLIKVAFFQEVNGIQYPLNNGAFNALQLIEVL